MKPSATLFVAIFSILNLWMSLANFAQGSNTPDPDGERVDVEKLAQQYWDTDYPYEIVQSRPFPKESHLAFELTGGNVISDPFLDVTTFGLLGRYHLTENWNICGFGWKSSTDGSRALHEFEWQTGSSTDNNRPRWFAGGELGYSPVSGKLTILGQTLLYYDMNLSAGSGFTGTESGTYLTPLIGISEQIFIQEGWFAEAGLRLTYYRETIIDKYKRSPTVGKPVMTRNNWSKIVTLGVGYMWVF